MPKGLSDAVLPGERYLIRLYAAFQVLFDLLIWLPIFYEFQTRAGLTPAQILSIQSLHYLSFAALEIPTGFIADRFGYRYCLRWGAVIFSASNLLPIFTPTYAGFAVHFVLIALSRSLVSGAANAYLYEYLKHLGAKDDYKAAEGRARSLDLTFKVIAWAGVGYLMSWHATLPYWLTAFAGAMAFIVATTLPKLPTEIRLARHDRRLRAFLQSRAVIANLVRSPWLVLVMLQGLGVFVLGRLQVTFFQPILTAKGFDVAMFGVMMSVMTLVEALGSANSKWLKRRINDVNAVFTLTACIALSFVLIALTGKIGTIAGFAVFFGAIGLVYPIQKQVINDAITEPSHRATLLSIESLLDRGASAGLIALAGTAFSMESQMNDLLIVAAVGTLAWCALLAGLLRRRASPPIQFERAGI